MQRAQWDSDGTDEGQWRTGDGFGGLEQATQARQIIAIQKNY
jgi:hypothetical protein